MALNFAGFEIPFDSADMGDAVGEFSNILAGRAKMRLTEQDIQVKLSLPNVLRANDMTFLSGDEVAAMQSYFNCEHGDFWLGIHLKKSNRKTNVK